MASGVIDVLRGVVLVDSHSQWGEFAFASGEVIEDCVLEKAVKDIGYDFMGMVSEPYVKRGLFG